MKPRYCYKLFPTRVKSNKKLRYRLKFRYKDYRYKRKRVSNKLLIAFTKARNIHFF